VPGTLVLSGSAAASWTRPPARGSSRRTRGSGRGTRPVRGHSSVSSGRAHRTSASARPGRRAPAGDPGLLAASARESGVPSQPTPPDHDDCHGEEQYGAGLAQRQRLPARRREDGRPAGPAPHPSITQGMMHASAFAADNIPRWRRPHERGNLHGGPCVRRLAECTSAKPSLLASCRGKSPVARFPAHLGPADGCEASLTAFILSPPQASPAAAADPARWDPGPRRRRRVRRRRTSTAPADHANWSFPGTGTTAKRAPTRLSVQPRLHRAGEGPRARRHSTSGSPPAPAPNVVHSGESSVRRPVPDDLAVRATGPRAVAQVPVGRGPGSSKGASTPATSGCEGLASQGNWNVHARLARRLLAVLPDRHSRSPTRSTTPGRSSSTSSTAGSASGTTTTKGDRDPGRLEGRPEHLDLQHLLRPRAGQRQQSTGASSAT
jgi:hypothetical protein